MANEITINLVTELPWWWRIYAAAAWLCELTVGGVDPQACGKFIARHTKIHVVDAATGRRGPPLLTKTI